MSDSSGPVFPVLDINHLGLTKRELFAAMTMQGLMANMGNTPGARWTAATSVDFADALLKQLAE